MLFTPCEGCGNGVPLASASCPHCGRPGPPPNVKAADAATERQALDRRYESACDEARARGAGPVVEDFETALQGSKAVMARSFRELDRLASSDSELFSTYYNLIRAQVRLPHGDDWDELRAVADEVLFTGYKEHIRFAALSLNGAGLPHYGEVSFVFREAMIAHRATVYEENSVLFLETHDRRPPVGHRATWENRAKLAVAKHGRDLTATTTPDQFAGLLLAPGSTPEDDRFIEVHIYGPLSIRSVERVLMAASKKGQKSARKAIRERLHGVGLSLEELP